VCNLGKLSKLILFLFLILFSICPSYLAQTTFEKIQNDQFFYESFNNLNNWKYSFRNIVPYRSEVNCEDKLEVIMGCDNEKKSYFYCNTTINKLNDFILLITLSLNDLSVKNISYGLRIESIKNNSEYVECLFNNNENLTYRLSNSLMGKEKILEKNQKMILGLKINASKITSSLFGKNELNVYNPIKDEQLKISLFVICPSMNKVSIIFDDLLLIKTNVINMEDFYSFLNEYWLIQFDKFRTPDPEHYHCIFTRDAATAFLSDTNLNVSRETYELILDKLSRNINNKNEIPDHICGNKVTYNPSTSTTMDNNLWYVLMVAKYVDSFDIKNSYYEISKKAIRWYDKFWDGLLWYYPKNSSDWRDTIQKSGYISSVIWLQAVTYQAYAKMALNFNDEAELNYALLQLSRIYENYDMLLSDTEDHFIVYKNKSSVIDNGGEYDTNALALMSNLLDEKLKEQIIDYLTKNIHIKYGGLRTPIRGFYPEYAPISPPGYYGNGAYRLWQNAFVLEIVNKEDKSHIFSEILPKVIDNYGCLHEYYNIDGETIRFNNVSTAHMFFGSMQTKIGMGLKKILINPKIHLNLYFSKEIKELRIDNELYKNIGNLTKMVLMGNHSCDIKINNEDDLQYIINATYFNSNLDEVELTLNNLYDNKTILINIISDQSSYAKILSTNATILNFSCQEKKGLLKIYFLPKNYKTYIKFNLNEMFKEGLDISTPKSDHIIDYNENLNLLSITMTEKTHVLILEEKDQNLYDIFLKMIIDQKELIILTVIFSSVLLISYIRTIYELTLE